MTIRCSETWSQLFLMSAFSCLLAGVVFYLTTDCEEIDSVVDPVAEAEARKANGSSAAAPAPAPAAQPPRTFNTRGNDDAAAVAIGQHAEGAALAESESEPELELEHEDVVGHGAETREQPEAVHWEEPEARP
jgi:hypothetical protein